MVYRHGRPKDRLDGSLVSNSFSMRLPHSLSDDKRSFLFGQPRTFPETQGTAIPAQQPMKPPCEGAQECHTPPLGHSPFAGSVRDINFVVRVE